MTTQTLEHLTFRELRHMELHDDMGVRDYTAHTLATAVATNACGPGVFARGEEDREEEWLARRAIEAMFSGGEVDIVCALDTRRGLTPTQQEGESRAS